jgi:pSer/pThr/pTyr-binding forkhead associated (FHA) protein
MACFDLGARAGIQWDDGRPARSGWLDAERIMGIGPYMIRRVDAATPSVPADATTPLNFDWDGSGPEVFLEFPDESGGPVRWHVRRAITLVGRAPSCRVRLPDISVSWFHCSLVRTPEGLWVVDLLSRGGLTVNGVGQRCSRLEDGDELFVGRFRMIPRYATDLRRGALASSQRALGQPRPVHRAAQLPAASPAPSAPGFLNAVEVPLEPEIVELLTSQRSDTNSPALIMLIEKFGQMQQQMLEQFHQTMMMMMQHMGERYREEVQQVRVEVDRLRELSEELVTLKGQLAPPTAATALPSYQPVAPESISPPAIGVPIANGRHPSPTTVKPEPPPEPKEFPEPVSREEPRPSSTGRAATGEDPLVMVTRRIAQIRSEQRSRWQKILDLVRVR